MRLLREKTPPVQKGRGRKKDFRQEAASKFLRNLGNGNAGDGIRLSQPLFVHLKTSDCLLAAMNHHSDLDCYLPCNKILEAVEGRFEVDENGSPPKDADFTTIRTIQSHMEDILTLLNEPELTIFNAPTRNKGGR